MSIWQQLRRPWQKLRRKNNDKNSQDYHDDSNNRGGAITQSTTLRTTTNSEPQNAAPKSSSKKIQIITDDPAEEDALYFQSYSENLANIIREAKPRFAIGIFGKWGTGKTTLMRMIKRELDKDNEKVLTVWFDAWRYEKEKYLAVIPFLRQIRIALEKDLKKQEDGKNGKSSRWTVLRDGLEKTFTAFMVSTEFSVSPADSPVSTSTNLEKFYDSLKSKGSVFIDGERKQFHEHSTDYLQAALNELRKDEETEDSRIVVFVDDLDRCTPQNALEVIESIKTFFDINGIVYVIGMDSESINHIIKQKYEGSNIDGLNYLQKIVQLPFQIPVWKPQDIHEYISNIILKGLEGDLLEEFEKDNRKLLIVKAVEPNPRQVKRFVNDIILANAVFGQDIDIKFDKLIAVQALNFRTKWNKFLELISENDATRKTFFEEYYIPPKGKGRSIRSKDALDSFIKEQSDANRPLPEEIIKIFQELIIKQEDGSLKSFLDDAGAAEILRDIVNMEDYRRALEATKFIEEEEVLIGKQRPIDKQLLELLRTGRMEEFNKMRRQHAISPNLLDANLSGANLSGAWLSSANLLGANLSGAWLSSANLSSANLSSANLIGADLPHANLLAANLSSANLSDANLSDANLSGAKLSDANLSSANLSSANLIGANLLAARLSRANLSDASLSSADLSDADLSYADLSRANLIGADLSRADLLAANLSGARLSDANLSYANLDSSIIIGVTDYVYMKCKDADFINAIIDDERLSIQLRDGKAKNVPPTAKNKKELREMLEKRRVSPSVIDAAMSYSTLPE
jgi:uncharacterized protein YjbI with pentapeptide repeats/molybdopterin-guanine dinucleotide biosynthesis protein A